MEANKFDVTGKSMPIPSWVPHLEKGATPSHPTDEKTSKVVNSILSDLLENRKVLPSDVRISQIGKDVSISELGNKIQDFVTKKNLKNTETEKKIRENFFSIFKQPIFSRSLRLSQQEIKSSKKEKMLQRQKIR